MVVHPIESLGWDAEKQHLVGEKDKGGGLSPTPTRLKDIKRDPVRGLEIYSPSQENPGVWRAIQDAFVTGS